MATQKTELKHVHAGRAIFTQYHGPTNRFGSRVRAWLAGDEAKRLNAWSSWDYETEGEGNALKAALNLLASLRADGHHRPKKAVGLVSTYLGGGRYCFAICTDYDEEKMKNVHFVEYIEETSRNA